MVSLENLQKRTGRNYSIKFLIEDTNYKWVDFSKRWGNQDRLMSFPTFKHSIDSRFLGCKFSSSGFSIEVDNHDGFWDKPLTDTLLTIDGQTADFSGTKHKSEAVWERRRCQFRLVEEYGDQYYEKALGTYLIEDLETNLTGQATLKIVGLERLLMERDASTVKNGQSWYQNRTIGSLVKKLVEPVFGERNGGQVPNTFEIPSLINLATWDASHTLSTIGQPPQFTDTDGDGIGNVFYEKNAYTRAMCMAPALIGVTHKNDDRNTIYMGCDNELYRYKPTEDLYEKLGSCNATYKIRNIWYDPNVGALWIMASTNLSVARTSGMYPKQWMTSTAFIYSYIEDSGLVPQKQINNFYDGKQYYRKGFSEAGDAIKGNVIGLVTDNNDGYGPNVLAPYYQYVRTLYEGVEGTGGWTKAYNYDEVEDADLDGLTPDAMVAGGTDINGYIEGYNVIRYYYDMGAENTKRYIYPRLSLGQQGMVAYNPTPSANFPGGCIIYCCISGATHEEVVDFWVYNVATNITTKIESGILWAPTYQDNFYISACADSDATKFYLGGVSFQNSKSDASIWREVRGTIYVYDYSVDSWQATPLKFVDYQSGVTTDNGYIPIELYHSDGRLYVVVLDYFYKTSRAGYTSGVKYLMQQYNSTTKELIKSFGYSFSQPRGLVKYDNKLWFVQQQSGTLCYVDLAQSTYPVIVEDYGFPVVDGAYYLQTSLLVDLYARPGDFLMWGVASSVFDDQMVEESVTGFELFKHDSIISEHIDLADFSDLSIWDALGLLAQRANAVMGFDEEGNFFFRVRKGDSTASYSIYDKDTSGIAKARGLDNTFNYVELTPYILEFKQPEFTLYPKLRSKNEENTLPSEDQIELKQLDTLAKKIDMVCVSDGDANIGSDRTTGFPLFSFAIYEPVITARVAGSVTNGTSIELGSVFGGDDAEYGIHTDYYVLYTDEDEDETYVKITSVNEDTNYITVETPITVVVNQELKILRRNVLSTTSNFWSAEGVTWLTAYADSTTQTVNSADNLSEQMIIKVGKHFGRISSVDYDDNTIVLEAAMSTASQQVEGLDNSTVRGYFAPRSYYYFYEIGNTNVYMKFNVDQNGECRFKQGDKFTITCEGFSLVADEKSKQVAVNNDSIAKYGKKQFSTINNRFFTRKIAQQMARKIRTDWCWPKYTFVVTMPLSNYIQFLGSTNLARVDLYSEKLLPYRAGYKEPCYITSIQHNPGQGITTLELDAILPY